MCQNSSVFIEQVDLTNRMIKNEIFVRQFILLKKVVLPKPDSRRPNMIIEIFIWNIVSKLCWVGRMNFSSNFSMGPEEANSNDKKDLRGIISNEHSVVMTAVCGFIALFSFTGNLLLCIVILKRRSMLTKPYNVLIFNLAVTDMLTGEDNFIIFI